MVVTVNWGENSCDDHSFQADNIVLSKEVYNTQHVETNDKTEN